MLLLPTERNKLLLQWKGPYEVVELVNRMDYRLDVDGIVGTYHANITVGKQTLCKLSFVYTSQVTLTVRTEPKFGKYLMPFM